MSLRTKTWGRFQLIRDYPLDLAVVSVAAAIAYYVVSTVPTGNELRILVAMGLVLFLPGYALVAMLFPAKARSARQTGTTEVERQPRGIDTVERLGLSFVLSLAIVPIVVMILPVTSWGLSTDPVAASLAGVTIACSQIGVVRRLRVPSPDRFTVAPLGALRRRTSSGDGVTKTASSVILTIAIIVAAGGLLFAFVSPTAAGGFTELGLYTETDDGDLVAGEIPTEIEPGGSVPVTLSVENGERTDMEYSLVIQEQYFEDGEITERTELGELNASVSDGNTVTDERNITPTAEDGESVRISVLLYSDDVPDEPTNENADEDTHFWISTLEDTSEEETETADEDADEADDDDAGDEADDDDAGDEADDDDAGDEADDEEIADEDEGEGDDESGGDDGDDGDDDDGFGVGFDEVFGSVSVGPIG